jgi:predicted TIM-barrel fold metal-dependent hydrolase
MVFPKLLSRRKFLVGTGCFLAGATIKPDQLELLGKVKESIIDIHQHTNYSGRTNEQLLAHQRAMGITLTILLPAGRPVNSASTHDGFANGLQAECGGNETVYQFSQMYPQEFFFGANEVPDLPEAVTEIEKYLKLGGKLIAESKFGVECDSPGMQDLYQLASDYKVPILIHWQYDMYNFGFDRFHKMLEKYPKTNFIGHAQTWWANIDKNHLDQTVLYPKGRVTPGGLTDQLLTKYANMYGDLSAGSGLNALLRDEDHTRYFLKRHQNKLMYGSDCNDSIGHGPDCQGWQTIEAIRRLSPHKRIERKILFRNAQKLFKI